MDNFLKRKKWGKPAHSSISNNESAMKYFKAVQKVKYYNNPENADDSESDVLLSLDDEPDSKLVNINNGMTTETSSEQYRLLSTTVT